MKKRLSLDVLQTEDQQDVVWRQYREISAINFSQKGSRSSKKLALEIMHRFSLLRLADVKLEDGAYAKILHYIISQKLQASRYCLFKKRFKKRPWAEQRISRIRQALSKELISHACRTNSTIETDYQKSILDLYERVSLQVLNKFLSEEVAFSSSIKKGVDFNDPKVWWINGEKYTDIEVITHRNLSSIYQAKTEHGRRVVIKIQNLSKIYFIYKLQRNELWITQTYPTLFSDGSHLTPVLAFYDDLFADQLVSVHPFQGGKTLMESKAELSNQRKKTVFLDVLRGLKALHSQGLLHLDMNPHNVVINNDGRAFIIDFGFVQKIESKIVPCGTVEYLAPEMRVLMDHGDATISEQTDLFSFAVMLFEIIGYGCNEDCLRVSLDELKQGVKDHLVDETYNEDLSLLLTIYCRCTDDNPATRPLLGELECQLNQMDWDRLLDVDDGCLSRI